MKPATPSGLPFDDIRVLLATMPDADEAAVSAVQRRDAELTKPAGSLGALEDLVTWLAAWQARAEPAVNHPLVAVFAGNHGVAAQGVSAFPPSVTRQMVDNFSAGGAAINQICAANDLALKVLDLALEVPTGDITREAAMAEDVCAGTMAFGMEVLAGGADLLCIGEMGIGNTTIAAALYCALFGGEVRSWVGPGTGVDEAGIQHKVAVIETALACHGDHLNDPLEVLRRLGGREIAAMAGAILAARMSHVPVVVDGFVAGAAAAVLFALDPKALDHCVFAHVSAEPGHRRALDHMGKTALLDLGMRLGEGTGAALAATIVRTAARIHGGMATFASAGVAGRAKT
ncbi:MAG: nicotinate-nucleotide--dimethylbenzimidazole phosphoribosyltransferase [Alphaproteobacteria bacterium]